MKKTGNGFTVASRHKLKQPIKEIDCLSFRKSNFIMNHVKLKNVLSYE